MSELEDVKRRASELCVQLVRTEERCEAAEAENARLRAAAAYAVTWIAEWRQRQIVSRLRALASGSEGDTDG